MILLFLTGGLFLGWSLGANDAANVFGTAVGSRMIRLKTAALTCSIFVIVGAVVGGVGPSNTLGSLGSVNTLAAAFMVTLAAAFMVFWMTKLKIPVSTSQAIVGAIIGWNIYSGSLIDYGVVAKIAASWVVAPILSALFAIITYVILKALLERARIHLFNLDMYLRAGLLLVGAFGSYSLGANNIANVMGVFVPVSPFSDFSVMGLFIITGTQQLFLLGGIAIAVGVYTYSYKVIFTVGRSLLKLSPVAALVVVLSQGMVLFLFSSERLSSWLVSFHLPAIPLVPLSSSQAVIGAIIGIGIVKGGKGIRYTVLGEIAIGWILTPVIACIITFIGLFFMQNVFKQDVSLITPNSQLRPASQCFEHNEFQDNKSEKAVLISTGGHHGFDSMTKYLNTDFSLKDNEIGCRPPKYHRKVTPILYADNCRDYKWQPGSTLELCPGRWK